jgi:hypothetical protein
MHRLALDAKIIPQLVAALEGDATGYSCQRLAFFIYLRSQIHAREHNKGRRVYSSDVRTSHVFPNHSDCSLLARTLLHLQRRVTLCTGWHWMPRSSHSW